MALLQYTVNGETVLYMHCERCHDEYMVSTPLPTKWAHATPDEARTLDMLEELAILIGRVERGDHGCD